MVRQNHGDSALIERDFIYHHNGLRERQLKQGGILFISQRCRDLLAYRCQTNIELLKSLSCC